MNKKLRNLASTVAGSATLRRRLIALLVVYAIGTGILAGLILEMRAEAITSGEKVLSAFGQLTEEQTARTIQNVEQTLEIAEDRLTSAKSAGTGSAQEIHQALLALLASRPYLKAIGLLDRQGRLVYSSEDSEAGTNLSDRAYFVYHRDAPAAGFQLGLPVRGRASGEWLLPATRSVRGPDGEFAGVIVAAVDPLFFVHVWTVDRAIATQATALWFEDGSVLVRSPFDERAMGISVNDSVIASRIWRGSTEGTFETVSLVDGVDRLVAYRRLAAYPHFNLTVSQSTDSVLAEWWRTAWLVAVGWAIAGAGLAWLAVQLAGEVVISHASDDRYRVLFNASPYPMLVADHETLRFLAANEAAIRQYGWSLDELLAMTINDHYLPEDVPAMTERRKKHDLISSPTLTGIRHRKKDGAVIDVEMAVRLIDFEGRLALLAMVVDISARLSIEDQLRQSQKMEVVGQLTGGIAHDFNNILMVILGNIDVLLEEDLGISVVQRLEQIGEAVDRAATLTRQLLAFSRKQPLRPQPTDLNALVTDIGKLLRRTLGAQIEIDSVLAEDLCIINIDRSQLETALVNLCLNARDAMPNGGRLLIETSNVLLDEDYVALNPEAVAGTYALIEVSDAGSGIPAAELDKVFEPFFTTKEVGKGSGLGLSMVHGFIHQSMGHIKIYSEAGLGTAVKLYLPCTLAVADQLLIQNSTAPPRGTERILVVEDEPRVRAHVVQQLRGLGYVVTEADSGDAGLAAMESASPLCDLLLADILMPGRLDGKALADEVTRRWPKTKVVFMSGFSEASIFHHGRLDEGVLLLSKPFRKGDLARMVRRALDASLKRPELADLTA